MHRRRNSALAGCVLIALGAVACTGSSSPGSAPTPASSPTTTPSLSTAPTNQRTVWLCRPDRTPNPCTRSRSTTALLADGTRRGRVSSGLQPQPLDCFYVYPTVSRQSGRNADLEVEQAERDVAFAQAALFSSTCRVWAPMYEQRTIQDLSNLADSAAKSPANLHALRSLEATWRDYLAHHNNGRPVVFIGHSQGAAMLVRLLRADVDPVPALRRKTALAILLGANVTVQQGKLTGGSFQHLPLCTRVGEPGCVIAYSSFPSPPPTFSFFGRPGLGVSTLSGETANPDSRVACVNPAAIAGGRAPLHSYFPTAITPFEASTPWVDLPDTYAGRCRTDGRATWLQVTPIHGPEDPHALLREDLGAQWGYHIADVNLALGDLVDDVHAVSARLAKR